MAQSPDKTRIGPPATIVEPSGVVWSIRSDGMILRAASATASPVVVNARASEMKWVGGVVYAHNTVAPNHWWKVTRVQPNGTVIWADAGVNDPATSAIPIPTPIPTPPPAQAVVTFSAASMNPGSPVTVSLSGGAGNAQDWMTITKVTDPPTAHGEWSWAPTAAFSWTTTLPAVPGQYEVRYFLNNTTVITARSAPFTVTVPYAAPVKSFPPTLNVAVGVPVSLLQYVSSALPLVFDPVDDADKTLTAAGLFTAKRVVAAGTVSSAVDDGH